MLSPFTALIKSRRREDGQTITEYALVLFIVSIAVVALITAIGAIADGQLGNLTSLLNSLTP